MITKRSRNVDHEFIIMKRTSRHKTLRASSETWDGPFETLKQAEALLARSYATDDDTFFVVRVDYERVAS